jgi:hypothetical protein
MLEKLDQPTVHHLMSELEVTDYENLAVLYAQVTGGKLVPSTLRSQLSHYGVLSLSYSEKLSNLYTIVRLVRLLPEDMRRLLEPNIVFQRLFTGNTVC